MTPPDFKQVIFVARSLVFKRNLSAGCKVLLKIYRWQRGVGARTVVLELTIVVASCGPFGAPPEGQKAKRTRK